MKLHIDFDSYFVNAQRRIETRLINKACVIYAGSDEDFFDQKANYKASKIAFMSSIEIEQNPIKSIDYKHFTAIAVSYEAKKYGIKVGDKLNEAFKKCPNLLISRSNLSYYKSLSNEVREFLISQIPVIEQFSIDEFFGDLAGFKKDDEAFEFAKYLQNELLNRFKLPASIGISYSKWSAKLLTDLAKPFGIKYETNMQSVIKGLDISYFPGIGKQIQKYLRNYGVNTLDELVEKSFLLDKYGKNGTKLLARIKGIDNEAVSELKDTKSHGISKSFKPINDFCELQRRMKILTRYLNIWLVNHEYHPKKIDISVKYGAKYEHTSLEIAQPLDEKNLLKTAQLGLEKILPKNTMVYYLGISAMQLEKEYESNLFNDTSKSEKLNKTLNDLRNKFGISCINYGK